MGGSVTKTQNLDTGVLFLHRLTLTKATKTKLVYNLSYYLILQQTPAFKNGKQVNTNTITNITKINEYKIQK